MENSHVPVTRPAPVAAARGPGVWVAPMTATALSFLLIGFGAFAIGFAAMATDSCGPDDCSWRITVPLDLMGYGLYAAPFVTPFALIVLWVLALCRRWTVARRSAMVIALLPGLTAVGGLVLLVMVGG
ncbi:hypothetical protein ACFVFH_24650 [Streptomyces sp. NPDC057697]|uniref:hypothetical protein n=1 Tax=Streptomyces sp. NPDC057697 TaxID=3346219 RepID=UPI0036813929